MATLQTVTTITADDESEHQHVLAHLAFNGWCIHNPCNQGCDPLPDGLSISHNDTTRTTTVTQTRSCDPASEWAVE